MLEDPCKRRAPTLLRYASVITEQKKCWDLSAQTFDRFQTLCNNSQQHVTTCNRVNKRTQHVTSNNVLLTSPNISFVPWSPRRSATMNMLRPFFCTGLKWNACYWERFPYQDLLLWNVNQTCMRWTNTIGKKTLFNLYRTTFSLRYLNVLKLATSRTSGRIRVARIFRQLPQ